MKKIVYLTLILVFFDHITKFLIEKTLLESIFINKFIGLQPVKNQGIAFGIEVPLLITIVLTVFIILGAIYYLHKNPKYINLSISLFFAGAFGNLIDRVLYQYVFDFIYIFPFQTFNFADLYLSIFLIIYIYQEYKSEKAK